MISRKFETTSRKYDIIVFFVISSRNFVKASRKYDITSPIYVRTSRIFVILSRKYDITTINFIRHYNIRNAKSKLVIETEDEGFIVRDLFNQ